MTHYGKREAGGLTASNPGDTLYFAFSSYNDSGDSEPLTGLAVTDIEVFKNGLPTTRATDSGYSLISDTGMMGDRAGLYRFSVQLFNTADDTGHFESGAWYQVAVDSVTIDGKTVRLWAGSFEIGRQRVDVRDFNDTGVNQRFAQIQSDVDTGLRAQISDVDTGLHDTLSDYDTGLRGILQTTGVNVTKLVGDTGAANWLKTVYTAGFTDTGLYNRLDRIQFEVDTGIRNHISDIDTGLRDYVDNTDTGLRSLLTTRFNALAEDTGGVNINSIQGDTGAAGWLKAAFTNGFSDTGLYSRLDKLAEDTGGVNINAIAGDTGAAAHLAQAFAAQSTNSDTGLIQDAATIRAKTDSLTFTVSGQVDANIQSVNDVTVNGTGASGDEWGP